MKHACVSKGSIVLFLLLITFLIGTFSAAAIAEKNLEFIIWYGAARGENLKSVIRNAAAERLPDVTLTFLEVEPLDKQLTMFAGGSLPDIVTVHSTDTFPQLVAAGALKPLSIQDSEIISMIPPELFEPFTYNGLIYGIPLVVELSNVGVNLSLLAQVGLAPPTFDWNWNDLVTMSKRLTIDTNGDGVPDNFGLTALRWDYEQFTGPFVYANGGSYMNKQSFGTEVTIDSPATIGAYEFLRSLIHDLNTVLLGNGNNEWNTGKVGFIYTGSWALGSTRTAVGDKFDWDYIPFPKSPQTNKRAGRVSLLGLSVSSNSKHFPEANAVALLSALREVQQGLLQTAVSAVPTRSDLFNSPYFLPPGQIPLSARATIIDNLNGGYIVPDTVYPDPQMGRIALSYIRRILQSGESARLALESAAQEMRAYLK